MKKSIGLRTIPWLLFASMTATAAHAAGNKVVIGDIDDMSGLYADVIGPGGIEAAKMAIEDFGGSVLGNKIELLTSDHQNKPDLGAQKFREWADRDGLTMVLGGSNTGVSIAMATIAKEKKTPFFAIGAAGASLTGKDCTPYTVHYAYDTTALGNGTATTMVKQGGKTWFFLTADYAFGTQLQEAAAQGRGSQWRQGDRRGARAAVDLGLLELPAAGAEFRRAGAGACQRRQRLHQLDQGGRRVRHRQDDEARGPARLHQRHPQPRPEDRPGPLSHHRLVLGPQRQDPRLRQALFREDQARADHEPGGLLLRHHDLSQRGQGRGHHRSGQGDGGTAQGEDRRHVHRQRQDPRRRPDGT